MDLLEELGDEIHIKAEDLSDFEDETQIEAVYFSDSLLHELKDENQIEAEVLSTSDTQMEGNASTQGGLETLPNKRHSRYASAYEALIKWKDSKQVNSFAEPVLLDYFRELSEKYKPSSLWSMYSIIKSTLNSNHDINISGYSRLSAFLKQKAYGFQSKKSKEFTAEDVNKFLTEAPDDKYLAMKVVLVFGVIASCSVESIANVATEYVKDTGSEIIVRIPHLRSKIAKAHVIDGQFAAIVRKYMKVRPQRCTKFLMQYRDGKCINQVIGRSTLSRVPKVIAKFLKLPESEAYTGYSFHITSKAISVDTSVAIETRHGQWKPSTVGEENVHESFGHERKMIAEELNFTSTSNIIIGSHENASVRISPATITSSESCPHDESTGDIPENNALSEDEDESTQEGLESLPGKSYVRYLQAYDAFKNWQNSKEINSFAEPVLLDYFRELSEKYKPSSLWSPYSMLKSTILRNHNINISEYSQLSKFLREKAKADGPWSKESKIFTAEGVTKFLVEAPDFEYLAMKTVSVFALIGACNLKSIVNVMTDHVADNGNEIMVRIFNTKTKFTKASVIGGQFAAIVRKYMKLRPTSATTQRFFMQYRDGKCINQVLSKNTITKVPKNIAKFLNLPESEAYTGYSFRITTLISANTSVAIETRHVQWKPSTVAKENVQESVAHERRIIAENLNFTSHNNVIIGSHENASVRIAPATITSSQSWSDESTSDVPENNSSENESNFEKLKTNHYESSYFLTQV